MGSLFSRESLIRKNLEIACCIIIWEEVLGTYILKSENKAEEQYFDLQRCIMELIPSLPAKMTIPQLPQQIKLVRSNSLQGSWAKYDSMEYKNEYCGEVGKSIVLFESAKWHQSKIKDEGFTIA